MINYLNYLSTGPPEAEENLISDFINLELVNAHPRLLMDFGSGTLELRIQTKNGLDDGDWHRIDLFWTREEVRMVVDFCRTSIVVEHEDGTQQNLTIRLVKLKVKY